MMLEDGWWWHLVAIPVYLWLGIVRHEGMHAILIYLCPDVKLTSLKLWPHRAENGLFYFGWCGWSGKLSSGWRPHVYLAPYYMNAVLVLVGVLKYRDPDSVDSFHWWAFAVIMLVISPAIDTLYAATKAVVSRRGDLAEAFDG